MGLLDVNLTVPQFAAWVLLPMLAAFGLGVLSGRQESRKWKALARRVLDSYIENTLLPDNASAEVRASMEQAENPPNQ